METKKALICGAMLAHSNMGFGLPSVESVRSEVNPRPIRGRTANPTVTGLVENFFQQRIETHEHVEIMSEETEAWVERFELDSYTDEQFQKDYPDAQKLWEQASIPSYRAVERFDHAYTQAETSNMFYIPETKEDMDNWIESQPSESITAIAVMVGFNYAMAQMAAILRGTK